MSENKNIRITLISFKYLYLIFRLFKCPHRYQFTKEYKNYRNQSDRMPIAIKKHYTCNKCGKVRVDDV